MKPTAFLLAALLTGPLQGAQQVIPEPFPDARYDKLKSDWPFTLAKAAEPKEEEKVSWAHDLWLSSVVIQRTAEGGEQPWVTIKDKSSPGAFIQLTVNEEKDGMQLVKVENLDEPKKTTATLKKNNEFATIKRDETDFNVQAAPVQPGGQRQPGILRPGQVPAVPVPNAQNAVRVPGGAQPNAAPGLPRPPGIPRPTTAAPVPAPNANVQAPAGAAPAGQPAQPDARKRIRVINSK